MGSYSSGYCSGFTPDSLLIPVKKTGNLNMLTQLQKYSFYFEQQFKRAIFLYESDSDSRIIPKFAVKMKTYKGIRELTCSLWLHVVTVGMLLICSLSMMAEPVDSLYTLYLSTSKARKPEMANRIFRLLKQEEYTDTLVHFEKTAKDNVVDARTHLGMAEYYYYQGDFEASMTAGERAKEVMEKIQDKHLQSDIFGALANSHFRLSNYDKALDALLSAYKIDKQLGDKELISSDLNTLAAIYLAVQRPDQGINYIEQAIALERELQQPDCLAIRLGIASELYLMDGQIDKAMQTIQEAYDIDHRDGREEKAAIRLSQMGAVYIAMSMPDKARGTINRALKILENGHNIYSIAVCHNQLGSIALKTGSFDEATIHYKKALELSIKCGSPRIELDAERGLWQSMREDNPPVALLHLERYTVLNDSLHQRIESAQMNVMNTTATNIEQNALSSNYKSNRLLLRLLGGLLALMVLLTVGGLFYVWRRSKNALKMQQEAQGMRSHFINNITHELRTPLTVVINAGEQLREGVKTSSEENRRLGDIIYNHGNNMLQLVNQLIDIDYLREPDAPNASTSINGDIVMFVKLLVDNFTEKARQEHIMLEFTSPMKVLMVTFNTEYISKILHLLLENAFKFTPAGGSITVEADSPEKGVVRLRVADTGKGIPVQERDNIFESFYQGDENYEGVTPVVNLALVKQIVMTLHGTIDIDTETGRGTTISINLPLPPCEAAAIQPFAERRLQQNNAAKQKPLVFIVENNDDVAFFIGNNMRHDYELRFANNGLEALQNARNLAPDLIITNMMMPVMDGMELMKRLREDEVLNHVPVIAMTSSTSEQERIACLQAGADAILVKPFLSVELSLLAKRLIAHHDIIRERFAKSAATPANESPAAPMSKEDKVFINRLVDVIHVQMAKGDIDMDRIAAAMSISRKLLRQRVMDITGLTPVTFALQVRLKRASRMLLSNEEIPLSVIASKCGFQTPSHFSKSFKQLYGISPIQYRKNGDNLNIDQL